MIFGRDIKEPYGHQSTFGALSAGDPRARRRGARPDQIDPRANQEQPVKEHAVANG
jgi:hypothetical protein